MEDSCPFVIRVERVFKRGPSFNSRQTAVRWQFDSPLPSAYIIVEKVDGHLLECRSTSSLPNLVAEDAVERWIAVGVRPLHAATEFSLALAWRGGRPECRWPAVISG